MFKQHICQCIKATSNDMLQCVLSSCQQKCKIVQSVMKTNCKMSFPTIFLVIFHHWTVTGSVFVPVNKLYHFPLNLLFHFKNLPHLAFITCWYPWWLSHIQLQAGNVVAPYDALLLPVLDFSPVTFAMHLLSSGFLSMQHIATH
jgi:hypothetical protein